MRSRGMTLATRDTQDFAGTGVQVVDPGQRELVKRRKALAKADAILRQP
jgi:hypothetical protein